MPVDNRLGQSLEIVGSWGADCNHIQILQGLHSDSHFANETGGPLRIRHKIQVCTRKLPNVAVWHDHSGAQDVLLEPARLEGADSGASLGKPSADGGRWVTGRVESQGQVVFGKLPVEFLPENAALDPCRKC